MTSGKQLLGLATGLVFGALLQRGRMARHEVIHRQLRLKDHRVAKVMGTAVAVGAAGLCALQSSGFTRPEVKPLKLGGIVGGGVLFGAGMAVLGYCPGTSVAAVGEGNRDAVIGVLGMFAGAAAFVAFYPALSRVIEAGGDFGKLTLPGVTRTPAWPWVSGLLAAGAAALAAEGSGRERGLPRLAAR